ncbi:MAG: Ig-like domain-containing protein [Bacteroidota bacterium]
MQKLLLYICILFVCVQCAQITPLTGGKKDTEAPKLLKAIPANASLNVTSKTIELTFDEYITLKDVTNQFIITPQTKELPDIEASGKKVKVKFNETLLPNTTYKLSFGNAIVDLRESNNLPNFEYVFSTGNSIDSLKLRGTIADATDKRAAAQVLVGLYSADAQDSIIYKEKPLYLIRTNEQGKFAFNYLPDKPFKIVGIKDQNKNLLYDGSDEQIAYKNTLADPRDTGSIDMLLFKEIPFKNFIKRGFTVEYGRVNVAFNKPQTTIKEVKADGLILSKWNTLKDSISLYYANKYDTLEVFVSYTSQKTDTLYIKIPAENLKTDKPALKKALKYNLKANLDNSVPYFNQPVITLNYPVYSKNIDQKRIIFVEKGDTTKPVIKSFKLLTETEPALSFTLQTQLSPETNYTVSILDSTLINEPGRFNDSTGYKFRTTSPDDYAQLNMKLMFPKKENYIVILQNEKGQIVDKRIIELSLTSTSEKLLEYKNLLPGNYFIQATEDANKNGLFDMGDYFLHTQPETIFINTAAIKLLAGWEIENEWQVK